MKMTIDFKQYAVGFVLLFALSFFSCSKDDEQGNDSSVDNPFPETLVVDVPDALSAGNSLKSSMNASSVMDDGAFDGNEIYRNLRVFVALAENGAEFVQEVMDAVRIHNLARELDFNFTSDDDKREKHLVVKENQTFEGIAYKFGLTLTDLESESDSVKGIGLQLFWSGNPVKGVALVKPINFNRASTDLGSAVIRIDYTEAVAGYDATMIVSISGLPTDNAVNDKFVVDNIKMFVGKKGAIVDVYGNSNHPYAYFTSKTPSGTGLNYAFVASANDQEDYAVAEVSLPPSTLGSSSRTDILETYSIKNVLVGALVEEYGQSANNVLAYIEQNNLLKNVAPPGYFSNGSFIASGTAPEEKYSELETRMNSLSPYSPNVVAMQRLQFGD